MKVAADQIFIQSDLKDYGYTDDGEPFISEVFRVLIQDSEGNRWAHRMSYPGTKVRFDEWGKGFFDIRAEARASCQNLIDRILAAGGEVDLQYWGEDRPTYGSLAYQAYGMADDLAWEKAQG